MRGRPSRQSIYDRLEEAIAELRERSCVSVTGPLLPWSPRA